jgi:iron complex outermembrane receptor protein
MKTKTLLAVSAAAIFASPGAMAQSALAGAAILEEIVVTATRREGVTVQDVPASITVIGADALKDARIESLTDLTGLSASLVSVTTQNPSSARIGLRGLSTPANNVGFEAAVGVSIDGVARSRTGLALSELPELERVEILRGPQGTLFGRNTSAGVISITTARPDPEGGGYLKVSAGNFDARTVQGAINVPMSDAWNGRIDAKYRERDGFIDDLNSNTDLNALERTVVRGQLTYDGDDSSLRLIADWGEDDSICCGAVFFNQNGIPPTFTALAAAASRAAYGSADVGAYQTALSHTPTEATSEWGVSAEYNRDIGDKNFTSITAYRDWESDRFLDGDVGGADLVAPNQYAANTSFSQEFRLQGENGVLNWLVGAFYLHDEVDWDRDFIYGAQWEPYVDLNLFGAAGIQAYGTLPTNPMAPGFVPSLLAASNPALATTYLPPAPNAVDDISLTTDAIALFTHNEISLSDTVTATVGLRYTSEDKELDYVFSSDDTGLPIESCRVAQGFAGTPLAALDALLCSPLGNILVDGPNSDDRSDDAVSGTAKLAWAVSDDALLYVSYSRGFKSGGYNLDRAGMSIAGGASPSQLEFEAEEVDAYEIGWNSNLADGKVTFNGAIYTQDVKNFQQLNFLGDRFEVAQGDFEVNGVELDLMARPLDNLVLQANYAYTDAENKLTGEIPNAQPENALSFGATLFLPLGESLLGTFHLNGRYQGEVRLGESDFQDGFTTLNARIAAGSESGTWELALFAQNLTDENQGIASFPAVLHPPSLGNTMLFPTLPRTYGAELRFNF